MVFSAVLNSQHVAICATMEHVRVSASIAGRVADESDR
jgi:hypothetical protein